MPAFRREGRDSKLSKYSSALSITTTDLQQPLLTWLKVHEAAKVSPGWGGVGYTGTTRGYYFSGMGGGGSLKP